jgi:AsmA protein
VKPVKWIAWIALGVAALLVAGVLVVTLLVDPNRYKGRIESVVRETTGQPFRISGDIDIRWFPWLALRTGAAQLGGERPLARWEAARVGARLLPLLRGELVIDRVRFEGLRLRLERDAEGRANWESLLAHGGDDAARGRPTPRIGGLQVRDGALEYLDVATGSRLELSSWRLDASEWKPGAPISVGSRFDLQKGADTAPRVPVELSFPDVRFALSPVTASVPKFAVRFGAASLEGRLDLEGVEPVRASGAVKLEARSLRRLLEDLAIGGPRPLDPQALGALELETEWSLAGDAVSLAPIRLQLDETRFTGSISRAAQADAPWDIALEGDVIDLDRYVKLKDTDSEPFELPTEALRALRAQGALTFREAKLSGATVKGVRLRLELEDGKMQGISPSGTR